MSRRTSPVLRYENLVAPRLVDRDGAGEIVCKTALIDRMVEHGWLDPATDRNSCKLFPVWQVHACSDLIERGFFPGEKDPTKEELAAARQGLYRPHYLAA